NSCDGAVDTHQAASLAYSLLQGGVPAVLAMQASVSDEYGSALARAFFDRLSTGEGQLASRALAHARRTLELERREALVRRKALELERRKALERGDDETRTLPEYATATLFVAGIESPLVDFGLAKQPLQGCPRHKQLVGKVPQLSQDEMIGRRRELRQVLWVLRPSGDTEGRARTLHGLHKRSALALVGIGGVGKSTIAGRAMQRLA